jgi:hypothetical protein
VTGTIKKNIQTTTIYIFCVVWVLTVPKYIDIRLYARSTNLRFCLGIIITPRHLRKYLGIYEKAGITILPLTYTLKKIYEMSIARVILRLHSPIRNKIF